MTRWTSRVGTLQKLCPDEEKMKEDKSFPRRRRRMKRRVLKNGEGEIENAPER